MVRRRDEAAWADPALLILGSLAEGPKLGYGIERDIEAQIGVRLGPGTVYGALSRMTERGLVSPLLGRDRRRPFELTPDGVALLARRVAALTAFAATCRSRLGKGPVG